MATTNQFISPVSLMLPGMAQYQVQQQQIARQQALANALQSQSLEPLPENQSAGGWAIPISPMQGLGKLAQAYAGKKMMEDTYSKQLQMAQQLQQSMMGGGTTPDQALSQGAAQGDIGPTVTNAARISQPTPQAGIGGMPSLTGDPRKDMMLMYLDPASYASKTMEAYTPTNELKNLAAAYEKGSPQYQEAVKSLGSKTTYIAPVQARQGSILVNPQTGQPSIVNPKLPEGMVPDYSGGNLLQPGANMIGTVPTATAQLATAQAAGKAYGGLPYQKPDVYQTPGAPTAYTPSQAIQQTGANIPTPGQVLNQGFGGQGVDAQGLPMNTANINDPAYQAVKQASAAGIPMTAQSTMASTPQNVGMTLQDQEAARAQIKSGEGLADVGNRIRAAGMDANLKINKFTRLGNLLESVNTGKLQPLGFEVAAYGKSLGFPIGDNVPNYQAAKALANEMALELRNPAGGAGMPGNFSDQDRNYLQGVIANVDKDPKANVLLVDGMIKMFQRDREIASLANQFKKAHNGVLTDDFFDDVQKYSDSHPLFPKTAGPVPASSTPAPQGIDPKLWSVMTPQEQALWAK